MLRQRLTAEQDAARRERLKQTIAAIEDAL
jgi:hypothetical protein